MGSWGLRILGNGGCRVPTKCASVVGPAGARAFGVPGRADVGGVGVSGYVSGVGPCVAEMRVFLPAFETSTIDLLAFPADER
jgi:hypothetical protein